MKIATTLLFALLSAPLFAQVYSPPPASQPRPRVVPPPAEVGRAREGLDRNLTVRLAGELATKLKVELALTGSGPRLSAQQFVGDDNQLLSCEFQLGEEDGGYRVSYSISVRVAIPVNQQPGAPPQIQYQDLSLNGTIVAVPGKAVEILRNGGRSLWVTVEEPAPAEKTPKAPVPPKSER